MEQIYELKESKGITNANNLFDNIKKININYTQENFLVFYLDTKNKVIGSEVLFKGGLNSCLIDAKTLFRRALINNSNSIIIAHNHPSGDLTPSNEDITIHKNCKKAGNLIGIKVLDSIIFNKEEFYSMIGGSKWIKKKPTKS